MSAVHREIDSGERRDRITVRRPIVAPPIILEQAARLNQWFWSSALSLEGTGRRKRSWPTRVRNGVLCHSTLTHAREAVRRLAEQLHVMGDQDEAEIELFPESLQEADDLS